MEMFKLHNEMRVVSVVVKTTIALASYAEKLTMSIIEGNRNSEMFGLCHCIQEIGTL